MTFSRLNADGKVLVMKYGVMPQVFDPISETTVPLRLPDAPTLPYSALACQDRR
jgi:hypothetical protein